MLRLNVVCWSMWSPQPSKKNNSSKTMTYRSLWSATNNESNLTLRDLLYLFCIPVGWTVLLFKNLSQHCGEELSDYQTNQPRPEPLTMALLKIGCGMVFRCCAVGVWMGYLVSPCSICFWFIYHIYYLLISSRAVLEMIIEMAPRMTVNSISLVTSCVGFWEGKLQTAYNMSFTWASSITASTLIGC